MNKATIIEYRQLYKTAFVATLVMLVIIPAQIVVFAATRLPATTVEWFELFRNNAFLGFFHADFFILVNNVLIAIIYLAFYHSLKEVNKAVMQIGLMLGLIGIAAYISSNRTFELLMLSGEYFATADAQARSVIEAAGRACLAGWQGTAFDAYYVLNGIALFCIALVMYKSRDFSRATATWGLFAAIFMLIPSTAGIVGLVFSLLSLVPWYVFSILYAKKFREWSK